MSKSRHRDTITALRVARRTRDNCSPNMAVLRTIVTDLVAQLGVSESVRRESIKVAGLQDIGMLGVSSATLAAARPLREGELSEIRRAPLIAQQLVASMPGYETEAEAVRHVHERWDGNGYPDGLIGDEIPVSSRIVAVALAVQAMSTTRPYRAAMSTRAISGELQAGAGTQFDPQVVDAMRHLIRQPLVG